MITIRRIKLFGRTIYRRRRRVVNTPVWNIPDAHKNKLTYSDLKFVFEQAEKLLKESSANSEIIVNRNNTLITIISTLLIALFSYVVAHGMELKKVEPMFVTSILSVMYLFALNLYTFKNAQPNTYLDAGSLPKDNLRADYFNPVIPDKKRILVYLMNEIINYQFKIEQNAKVNAKRWKRYKLSLFMLMLFPLLMSLAYWLVCVTWDSF